MPSCFVVGCKSSSAKVKIEKNCEGKDEESIRNALFRVPKNDEMFERWKRAIPRKDREMAKTDRVCSLHFDESQIEKYYETLMPDGTVDRIVRGHWKLKPGSVPIKFPGPKYLSKTLKTRKPPKVRNYADASYKRKRIKTMESPNDTRIRTSTDIENVPVLPENMDKHDEENVTSVISSAQSSPNSSREYRQLSDVMADLPNVTLPSSMWSHTILMEKLLFLEWDERLNVMKKLVVNETLRCQMFLGSVEVKVSDYEVVNTLATLNSLLKIMSLPLMIPRPRITS